MTNEQNGDAFSAPAERQVVDGLLFDMDGTIIDSTNAVIKHWHRLGKILGVDPTVILASSHGRRSIDVLQLYDPSLANWEYVSAAEAIIPREFGDDAIELPGSRALLSSLDAAGLPWSIVTSGTRPLVSGWLDVMKLQRPAAALVTAEDVVHGKPDPACYLLGRERLGLRGEARVLVFEDAPAGVRAGKAAGFAVVAVATTHRVEELKDAGADWVVRDLESVRLVDGTSEGGGDDGMQNGKTPGKFVVEICNAWR